MQANSDIVESWDEPAVVAVPTTAGIWPWLDRLGAGLSLTCALHCLAIPIVLLAMPALRAGLSSFDPSMSGWSRWLLWSHQVEWLMAVVVIGFAGIVLGRGWLVHGRQGALRWYAAGSLTLVVATLEWIDLGVAHGVLLAVGGGLIAWSHWSNLSLLRRATGRCRVAR